MKPSPRLRIALLAPHAYGAFSGFNTGHIGGIERQTALIARRLAAFFDVVVITRDEGQPAEIILDEVKLIKTCRIEDGVPIIRFFHPRWTSLLATLRKADADVYYQMGADTITGQISMWCRNNRRGFIFASASDANFDPLLPTMPRAYERWFYRRGLKLASLIVTQTRTQLDALQKNFGITNARVVRNPCAAQPGALTVREMRSTARSVLWVGRIAPVKRLEWLIEIAKLCPDLQFNVVGPGGGDYSGKVLAQAAALPNISVHGKVSDERLRELYQETVCLCCTSIVEGVPNTFLEAWSFGIPIVSTVDVDGAIARQQLGTISDSPQGLANALKAFTKSPVALAATADRAIRYFIANHSEENAMNQLSTALRDAASVRLQSNSTSALALSGSNP